MLKKRQISSDTTYLVVNSLDKFLIFAKEPKFKKEMNIPYNTFDGMTSKEIKDLINLKVQQCYGTKIRLEITKSAEEIIEKISKSGKFLIVFHNDSFRIFNEYDIIRKKERNMFELKCEKFETLKTKIAFERKIKEEIEKKTGKKYIHLHYTKTAEERIPSIIGIKKRL